MNDIYLPKHTGREAEIYAEKKLKLMGINKNSKDYQEYYNNYIQNFAHQAHNTMTAHATLGENPTPKITKKTFDMMSEMFGKKGYFAKKAGKDRTQQERLFRSSITILTNLILKNQFDLDLKTKNGDFSHFQYKEDGVNKLDVVKNQYIRTFIATNLVRSIQDVFNSDVYGLGDILEGLELEDGISDDALYKKLNSNAMREDFISGVYNHNSASKKKSDLRKNITKENKSNNGKEQVRIKAELVGHLIDRYYSPYLNDEISRTDAEINIQNEVGVKISIEEFLSEALVTFSGDSEKLEVINKFIKEENKRKKDVVQTGENPHRNKKLKKKSIKRKVYTNAIIKRISRAIGQAVKVEVIVREEGQRAVVDGVLSVDDVSGFFKGEVVKVGLNKEFGLHGLVSLESLA